MANSFIGGAEKVGVGIEATPGTQVAAQSWGMHMSVSLDPKTNVAENTSALGRYEAVNDSVITEQWMEGSINGKILSTNFGYYLLNIFGQVATAVHSGETAVWDNTFTIGQTGVVPALTFTRVNKVETKWYGYGVLTDLEIDIESGSYVMFTATFTGVTGQTTTATAAYDLTEAEFTSKNTTVKFASSIAGLAGATPADLKSCKLKLSRKVERHTPLGGIDPTAFDIDRYTLTGTIVQRWTDTVLENVANANTKQAMQIALVNSGITIGTAAHPGLVLTLPKVRLDPQSLSNNLDQVMQQTFNFTGELDATNGLISAVLTNTQNGYAHA